MLKELLFILFSATAGLHAMKLGNRVKCSGKPRVREFERKFVGVIFRHGDRTPERYNFGYRFQNGPGQLTNEGMEREYELGQHIRKEYGEFLGAIYHPRLVIARSTDIDRTKMSLQLVMAGLFPPTRAHQWNKRINWQPVVMNYVPGAHDFALAPLSCPKYGKELKDVLKLPEVQIIFSKYYHLMKNLSEWTGHSIKGMEDVCTLYDDLVAISSMGLKLPGWTFGIFPNGLLKDAMIQCMEGLSYNEKLNKLNGGMILKNFTDTMSTIVIGGGKSETKMILLSAHDLNVAALLIALDVKLLQPPKFSAAVFVELLEKNHQYYVRIYHYLGIPAERKMIAVPNCKDPCSFDNFMKLYSHVLPTKEEMC